MTVSSTVNRVSYAGNDVTTAFSFPYKFFADSDLVVALVDDATDVETPQTLATHYTVTGAGAAAGGTVTMVTAPATGTTLVIYRDPAVTQDIDLVNGDPFDVETGVERGFDKITLMVQRVKDIATRAMRLSDADTSGASTTLPLPTANRLLGWNSAATAIENKVPADVGLTVVTSFVNTLLDDATAGEFIETLRGDLTAETTVVNDDEVIIRDTSATVGKRITVRNFMKVITELAAEAAPDAADEVAIYDASAATADKVTLTVLAEAIRALIAAKSGAGGAENYSLSASVGANALTMTLSGAAAALSATNKAAFTFRSATAGTGTPGTVDATADLSLVISSGSTLGATSGTPFRLWWAVVNDAGTLRLAVQKCSTATAIYAIGDDVLISSTAEGGAGAADSAGVWYTGSAVTNKAARILGYTEHSLTTAGTWDEAPDKTQLWQPGMKLPGDVVQVKRLRTGTVATGTTVIPLDNTIPQNTEGDEYMSLAITPTAGPNVLEVDAKWIGSNSHANPNVTAALFRDSGADAVAAVYITAASAGPDAYPLRYATVASSTSSTTFKVRAGNNNAGTTTFNGAGGGALMGGVSDSFIEITERMG